MMWSSQVTLLASTIGCMKKYAPELGRPSPAFYAEMDRLKASQTRFAPDAKSGSGNVASNLPPDHGTRGGRRLDPRAVSVPSVGYRFPRIIGVNDPGSPRSHISLSGVHRFMPPGDCVLRRQNHEAHGCVLYPRGDSHNCGDVVVRVTSNTKEVSVPVSGENAEECGSCVEAGRARDPQHAGRRASDDGSGWCTPRENPSVFPAHNECSAVPISGLGPPLCLGSRNNVPVVSDATTVKMRRRMARLFHLPYHHDAKEFGGDPWMTEAVGSESWPVHVFDVSQGSIHLQKVVDIARRYASANVIADIEWMQRFMQDPALHNITTDMITSMKCRFQVPVANVPQVRRSRLNLSQLHQLQQSGIVETFNWLEEKLEFVPQVSIYAFTVPEAHKVPPRLRVIFDTLMANGFLDEADPVVLRSTRHLKAFFAAHSSFCTYDYKCFYFQFEWARQVALKHMGRIGNTGFFIKRGAMGHKKMVKASHSVTSLLAETAIVLAGPPTEGTESVEADVIIDNVCFGGPAQFLPIVQHHFETLCREANIIIGDRTAISPLVTHRGVTFDATTKLLRIKSSWIQKFEERVTIFLDALQTSKKSLWPMLRSIIGMINYVRCYFSAGSSSPLPSTFWVWKTAARWAITPRRVSSFPQCADQQLRSLGRFLAGGAAILLHSSVEPPEAFMVSDAMKSFPFAAWAAILVDGDHVSVTGGQFPLGISDHISTLELRAVTLAFNAWSTRLKCGPYTPLVLYIDNTAALFAITKGYSPAASLHEELMCLVEICTVCHRYIVPCFIASRANPADEPSRGLPLDIAKLDALRQRYKMEEKGHLRQMFG